MSNDWTHVTLGEICSPKQWHTIGKQDFSETGYPVYGANGIIGLYKTYNHAEPVIAVTCRGATCGSISLTKPFSYVTGNSMCLDEIRRDVDIIFLFQMLTFSGFKDAISGSAQPQITRSDISKVNILLPPLPEQKKIAEILSGIDTATWKVQSAVIQIDNAIQGIRDQTQAGEGDYTRIGDLIAKISTGVSVNSENRPCRASEHGILKVSCVSKGLFYPSENKVINKEEKERASMSIKKGMLLMSRANTPELVGACGIATNDHDNLFLPDKIWNLELSETAPCNKEWLNNALNSGVARSRVRDASTGTSNSMRNISQSNFCEIALVIPPIEIQRVQTNAIDSLQKRRTAFADKLERYLMLKAALSGDLLSGRKRVSV